MALFDDDFFSECSAGAEGLDGGDVESSSLASDFVESAAAVNSILTF